MRVWSQCVGAAQGDHGGRAELAQGVGDHAHPDLNEYRLERCLPRHPHSVQIRSDRETHMRAYVIPRIGGLTLEAVTGDHLAEMYDDLATAPTRPPPPR